MELESLNLLEEKVMLAVQTIRQLREEKERLKTQLAQQLNALQAATKERDALKMEVERLSKLNDENEKLRRRQDEIRARVEQIISKLEAFEKDVAHVTEENTGQKELLAEDTGP